MRTATMAMGRVTAGFCISMAFACAADPTGDPGRGSVSAVGGGGVGGTRDLGGAGMGGASGGSGAMISSGGASVQSDANPPEADAETALPDALPPSIDAIADASAGSGDGDASFGPVVLGGPSLPCNFAFCESFEGYADGAHPRDARWVDTQGTNQVIVDSLKPARGARALHIKFEPNPQQTHWMRTNEPFPKLARQHFGRIFVWIDHLPDAKIEYRHWVTVEMHPQGNGPVLRVLGGESPPDIPVNANNILKQNSAMFDLITPGEDRRREDTVHIGDKVWHCFEWSLDVDANRYRMWLNGKPMTGASWDKSNPIYTFAPISYLWLGWTDWHNDSANWEVYLDEVVLDTQRIGCDR